jgi:uncharacterized Zn-binding protein involved in type VI secretion
MPSVCRLTDISETTIPDAHGCPACPHPCKGPAVTASGDVWVQGKQALRLGDTGVHAACCGPNTWTVIQASGQVFINGRPCVRIGDRTQHCGAIGKMTTGADIVVDGSPMMTILSPIMKTISEPSKQIIGHEGYTAEAPAPAEAPLEASPAAPSAPSAPSVPSGPPVMSTDPQMSAILSPIVKTIDEPIMSIIEYVK